jgi:hypothetical protein
MPTMPWFAGFDSFSVQALEHIYWSSACPLCPIKAQCTLGTYRRIRRSQHEAVLKAARRQLDKLPGAMTLRRQTVEHVFSTVKHWRGSTHYLVRVLPNENAEMGLHVLASHLQLGLKPCSPDD